jgi:hypothetical protein
VFYIQNLVFSRKSAFAVKFSDVNNDVCKIHSDFRSVLFPFTRDYLNLEMFKIFYLLGVYLKNV